MNSKILQMLFVVVTTAALSGCGGGDSPPAPSVATTPTPAPTGQSPADTIRAMVANGSLPSLDRSSDVKGPDTNGNGIRDDIDAWIDSQGFTALRRAAAQQHAKAVQQSLVVDPSNPALVEAASQSAGRSTHCVFAQFDQPAAVNLASDLEKLTVNTKPRVIAYGKFTRSLNGTVLSMPQGATCD